MKGDKISQIKEERDFYKRKYEESLKQEAMESSSNLNIEEAIRNTEAIVREYRKKEALKELNEIQEKEKIQEIMVSRSKEVARKEYSSLLYRTITSRELSPIYKVTFLPLMFAVTPIIFILTASLEISDYIISGKSSSLTNKFRKMFYKK